MPAAALTGPPLEPPPKTANARTPARRRRRHQHLPAAARRWPSL